MVENRSLIRRVKTHVTGRRHVFFAATPPHVNRICEEELRSLFLLDHGAGATAGGVEFEGKIGDCYHANLKLRTANRVLMRIGAFEATHFSKLERQTADFPWELYLRPDMDIGFTISTRKCRLYHKEAIRQRLEEGLRARFASSGNTSETGDPGSPQAVYVRGVQDLFTFSLDSSGEILYKRGIKTHGGKAPMRETTAAAILHLAGYTGQAPLIDPMCGSGTFSLEAALIAGNIPPGWYREFAFMQWPSFSPGAMDYIKKEARKCFFTMETPQVFASDIDAAMVEGLEQTVSVHGLAKTIEVSQKDFFEFHPGRITARPGFVFINPPYGIRMETQKKSAKLFHEVIRKLKSDYHNWVSILVVPKPGLLSAVRFGSSVHSFFHGGLNLSVVIGKI